ncbi:MAG: polyprenyl synthetase family protein [Anaerolineales bacterium]|nr:polyprenyl synthetase family protein [Anaerolineales bacterium]
MITAPPSLLTLTNPFEERLEQVEALLAAQVEAGRSPLETALAQLITAGGKRLRPRLALLTGSLLRADPGPLLCLAAAVEMLHTATLIHDDLVDGAGLRRGVETLNVRWPAAASVLVGDHAFTRAARLALATGSLPAIDLFTETMARMVDGEITHLTRAPGIIDQEAYYTWIGAKTAVLFELAAAAPALLGPAEPAQAAAARRFGFQIGMAFQVVDDVLDFSPGPSNLGKPAGQDLRQGTLTLPALLYYQTDPDDPDLLAIASREQLDKEILERLLARIRGSGALEAAIETAQRYISEGLEALDRLPEGPERPLLEVLARSIVDRAK